ncbi:hypothetical protein IQ255_22305 [Pleurocapsales cyanobacterium LEGE 10410]|nr:hypothetical protein [Pleurocapsales cyanobacterium LEGE 10410]
MKTFINIIDDKKLKQQLQEIINLNYSSDLAHQKFLEVMKRKLDRKLWLSFREQQKQKRDEYILEIIDEHVIFFLDSQNIKYSI